MGARTHRSSTVGVSRRTAEALPGRLDPVGVRKWAPDTAWHLPPLVAADVVYEASAALPPLAARLSLARMATVRAVRPLIPGVPEMGSHDTPAPSHATLEPAQPETSPSHLRSSAIAPVRLASFSGDARRLARHRCVVSDDHRACSALALSPIPASPTCPWSRRWTFRAKQ